MRNDKPKLLSLIIPVYRQEKTIAKNLRTILAELERFEFPYEIIVVVDGNLDNSLHEACKVKSTHLKVFGYETNRGKGYAVRFGMAKSKGDVIGFLDGGGDINEQSFTMMLEHFRWYNADIIVGSKRHPASKVCYPWQRIIMSLGYQILVRVLFGLRIRDSQVGIKLYRREVLEDVLPRLVVKKFAFDIELLSVAYHLGYTRIYEAPIELDFTGATSITSTNFWKIILRTLWDTLTVFYRLRILHYYDTLNRPQWHVDPNVNFR